MDDALSEIKREKFSDAKTLNIIDFSSQILGETLYWPQQVMLKFFYSV
jgi:hypothetical protein